MSSMMRKDWFPQTSQRMLGLRLLHLVTLVVKRHERRLGLLRRSVRAFRHIIISFTWRRPCREHSGRCRPRVLVAAVF